jgi:Rod binding domain-containing protein
MQVGAPDRSLPNRAEPARLGAPVAARPEAIQPEDPAKIRDAASQFEALLLAQMLKFVREGDGEGWLGAGDDEAGGMMLEVAQEHLAQALAYQGGLGLANLVAEGLSRAPASEKP